MSSIAISVDASRARGGWMSRLVRLILRVPLVAKIIGANILIVVVGVILHTFSSGVRNATEMTTAIVALTAATLVNLMLVRLALRPVEELEEVAERVSEGEFDVRSSPSPFADKDLRKLGEMVNVLLDSLARERKRIQDLGAEVVKAHDVERANVSRELHDSIAQTLAAVRFQISAASREEDTSEIRNRLAAVNGMISTAMEGIVNVSYSLHSRVAEELGIEAALESLARQVEGRSGVKVAVDVAPDVGAISSNVSVTLFRVAEETLRDVMMHNRAKSATVGVSATDRSVQIDVAYDCLTPERNGEAGLCGVLAPVKDRVMLAGGRMKIETAGNGRTHVTAELQKTESA